jgi:hypothetical protein
MASVNVKSSEDKGLLQLAQCKDPDLLGCRHFGHSTGGAAPAMFYTLDAGVSFVSNLTIIADHRQFWLNLLLAFSPPGGSPAKILLGAYGRSLTNLMSII